jgi:RNA polymerase sigma-70 factor (ECF subfamily)
MDAPAPSWEERLEAARRGDRVALGELLHACRPYLLQIAAAELDADLRAKAAPADLVQETFLRGYHRFASFRGRSEPELLAWLRQTLLRLLLRLRERFRAAQKCDVARERSLDAGPPLGGLYQLLIDGEPTPSTAARRNEEEVALGDALARLPAHYRRVLELRHREYLPFAAIARALGRSEDAVQHLYVRAVRRLRRSISAED